MEESTERESSKNGGDAKQDGAEANPEATSKETLKDLEENKKDDGPSGSAPDSGPSPDGGSDENSEVKDAGPM